MEGPGQKKTAEERKRVWSGRLVSWLSGKHQGPAMLGTYTPNPPPGARQANWEQEPCPVEPRGNRALGDLR